MLKGKHIILGITGGIAAYKSAWLVREFMKAGADVQVIMTRSACEFITPLTLATLSRRRVITEMFRAEGMGDSWTEHIELALWADVMLIAPASANTIAKLAHGLADNFLTTTALALRSPLSIAPSMDVDMYRNQATRNNIDTLKQSGCLVLDPDEGELASGLTGPGRLPDLDRLVAFVEKILDHSYQDLRGKKVVVTAGPTHESIDPVRFLGNRSSGKMGFAFANAAAQRGADVALVSGPVSLQTPRNTRRIDVTTAREMLTAVEGEFAAADLVIMSAAVADFSPANPSPEKIKRDTFTGGDLTITLRQNPDILKELGKKKTRQCLVGFALETSDEIENARKKLVAKNLDVIVLNNPRDEGAGFDTDTNVVTVITASGSMEKLPRSSKFEVAHEVLNRVVPLLR